MPELPDGPRAPAVYQAMRFSTDSTRFFEECAEKFGAAFSMRLPGQPPYVVFGDPQAARDLFDAPVEVASAGESASVFEFLLGKHSLLLLDGKRHARERKLMMPAFHGEAMDRYMTRMQGVVERVTQTLAPGQVFEAHPMMQRVTIDIILECIFGLSPGEEQDRWREPLVRFLHHSMTPAATLLAQIVPAATLHRALTRAIAPAADVLPLGLDRVVPTGPLARALRDVDAILHADIQARRRAGAAGRNDVISVLMEARDEDGQGLTDDELRDEMMTLLVAGHDTTATTLAWALSLVVEHGEVLDRVRRELREVIGDGPITAQSVRALPYLDATVREALRLYSPTAGIVRKLHQGASIGGRQLPGGIFVALSTHLLHRNPQVWPEPTRFLPERFLERKPSLYEYVPFGGGIRTCLGMQFALFESKVVLAAILSRLELRRAPSPPARVAQRGLLLGPSHGLPMEVVERRFRA